jgi:Late competence development protein ComFB
MENLVNIIESAVIHEATKQLADLPECDRHLVGLSDVVTYSLNRVPTMYATSAIGWQYLSKRIHEEMANSLENVVYWAIRNIITNERLRSRSAEPSCDRTPLPETTFTKPARTLYKLSQIFDCQYLEWSQVPSLTRKAIADLTTLQTTPPSSSPLEHQSENSRDYSSPYNSGANRALVTSIKGYLQRSHVKAQRPEQAKAWQKSGLTPQNVESEKNPGKNSEKNSEKNLEKNLEKSPESEVKQLYMASARLGYINVIEDVVAAAAKSLVKTVRMGLQAKIKLDDVIACALNLLPAMYASTEYGMKVLRHKIKTEMIETITAMVRQAIVQVCKAPIRQVEPTPLAAFDIELDRTIFALQTIFEHEQVTWKNVVSLVEAKLNRFSAAQIPSNDVYFGRAGIA